MSNRGRHKSTRKTFIKLAKSKGAYYPEEWNISLEDLNNLIKTQKDKCGFNNLHVFETSSWATNNMSKGGFDWQSTAEQWTYWDRLLSRIYTNIIKNNYKT